jgi:hypothetical protein
MFNQLFYTLPVFIEEWINTTPFYEAFHKILPPIADFLKNKDGSINPEMIVNLDAFFIIVFQMIISMIILKWRPISAMMTGIIIAMIGIGVSFYTNNSLYTVLGILIFAIGEMTSNPKFSDYIAKISPKGKEALYMGTYFLPIALANLLTKWITGDLYEKMSDKVVFIKEVLAEKGLSTSKEIGDVLSTEAFAEKASKALNMPVEDVMSKFIPQGTVDNWSPVIQSIKKFALENKIDLGAIGGKFSKNDFYVDAANQLNMSQDQMTQMLWDTYHPGNIWYVIAGIGMITVVGLLIYNAVIASKIKKERA